MRPIEWPSRVVKLFRIISGTCFVGSLPRLWEKNTMPSKDNEKNYTL